MCLLNIFVFVLGTGSTPNKYGVQYYTNLIKELRQNNIQPLVTLYHGDLPLALLNLGGMLNSTFSEWFANFARICFREFGEHVKLWATFNEGYWECNRDTAEQTYICGHNLIKAHAAAWHVYDNEFRKSQKGTFDRPYLYNYAEKQKHSKYSSLPNVDF